MVENVVIVDVVHGVIPHCQKKTEATHDVETLDVGGQSL